MTVPINSLVFGDEFLAQGLHLTSHQRCSAGIRTLLSADRSSSSTLTESSFPFLRKLRTASSRGRYGGTPLA